MTKTRRKEAGEPVPRIGWSTGFWRRTLSLWALAPAPFFAAFADRAREGAPEQGEAMDAEGEPADARPSPDRAAPCRLPACSSARHEDREELGATGSCCLE